MINLQDFKRKVLKRKRSDIYKIIWLLLPFFISILIFFQYLVPTWQKHKRYQEILKTKQKLIIQYKNKIESLKKEPLKKTETENPFKYVFTGIDPYVTLSEIQKVLENIENLKIRSFRIVNQKPFKDKKNIKKIEIHFELEGDIKTLAEILEEIEKYQKALIIKHLTVSKINRYSNTLRISLRIETLFLLKQSSDNSRV